MLKCLVNSMARSRLKKPLKRNRSFLLFPYSPGVDLKFPRALCLSEEQDVKKRKGSVKPNASDCSSLSESVDSRFSVEDK